MRMGRPKGLLEIGGRPFVDRVVRALGEGGCDPVFLVVSPKEEALAEIGRAAGAVVLENPAPGEGPITSLRLALAALPADFAGVAYLPLDHALVEARHVRALLAAVRESGARLALPVHGTKRGHPAYFGRELFGELSDPSLAGGARTVVHRHLDGARLLEMDRAVVTDIDTPEAYAEALRDWEAEAVRS